MLNSILNGDGVIVHYDRNLFLGKVLVEKANLKVPFWITSLDSFPGKHSLVGRRVKISYSVDKSKVWGLAVTEY